MRLMMWRALSMCPCTEAAAAASTLAAAQATADRMVAERDSTIAELESTVRRCRLKGLETRVKSAPGFSA